MGHERIVIFGASGGALKVADTLTNLGIGYEYFVDNDSKKWGTSVRGKIVKAPQTLIETDERILIASDYQSEIEEQLKEWNILERLILKEECILQYFDKRSKSLRLHQHNSVHTVIIELADAGICLGGIETWTLMVTRDLKKRVHNVKLWIREQEQSVPDDLTEIVQTFDYRYDRYAESIEDTMQEIAKNLPCTIISNWQSQVMIAAILVRRKFPDKIKIISVVHNDKIALYRRQSFLEPDTDFIFCVSQKIRDTFLNHYGVSADKLIYKESPVRIPEGEKQYRIDRNQPIRLGYAARISKYQKRADLLVDLIHLLDERKVNYYMEIAGTGSYYEQFRERIRLSNGNIILLGQVAREQMQDFWNRQDVFISVSDFEGTSISMLEAMAAGVVPVVTRVSGVDEFVEDGVNGYSSQPGDISKLVDAIVFLEQNRDLISSYGVRCRDIVRKKCNEDEYISVLEDKL